MTSYTIPGCRRKLRTNAARRWLIVSVFDGAPRVEYTTNDEDEAARKLAYYRRLFPADPRSSLLLIDQALRGGQ